MGNACRKATDGSETVKMEPRPEDNKSDRAKKDQAARAAQDGAKGYLAKKREVEAEKQRNKERDMEERLAREREAEAARLLQRAAAAHLALHEPVMAPQLQIPSNNNPVEQAISTARQMLADASEAVQKAFEAQPATEAQQASASDSTPERVKPPALSMPTPDALAAAQEYMISTARGLMDAAADAVSKATTGTADAPAAATPMGADAAAASAPSSTAAAVPAPGAASAAAPVLEPEPPVSRDVSFVTSPADAEPSFAEPRPQAEPPSTPQPTTPLATSVSAAAPGSPGSSELVQTL